MNEIIVFLLPPFVVCLIMVGMHCYLGLHVLARKVVFVDLALAQVAALGTVTALAFGYDESSTMAYLIALSATLLAAAILAIANLSARISQEAFVGILYALSSAGTIVAMDRLAHGMDHLKSVMVGKLLWITWPEVGKVALVYGFLGGIHYLFRKPMTESSLGQIRSLKWDFIFYALFGVVITSSVPISGVLLVFSFLIVPALLSGLWLKSLSGRLLLGWLIGVGLCTLGMALSIWIDSPSGATIVVVFTVVPVALVSLGQLKKIYLRQKKL